MEILKYTWLDYSYFTNFGGLKCNVENSRDSYTHLLLRTLHTYLVNWGGGGLGLGSLDLGIGSDERVVANGIAGAQGLQVDGRAGAEYGQQADCSGQLEHSRHFFTRSVAGS